MSASTWRPPRPGLMRIGPPSAVLPSAARGADASTIPRDGFSQRQQHDQHIGLRPRGRFKPSAPEKQATPGSDFGLALQPATLKPSAFSLAAASLPITPSPSRPTWASPALGCLSSSAQSAPALLAFVAAQLAQMNEVGTSVETRYEFGYREASTKASLYA